MGPFKAIGAFFSMFVSFCVAGERMGKSLEHLAEVAEEEAEGLKVQLRKEREARTARYIEQVKAA